MFTLPDEAVIAANKVIFDHYGFQTGLSVIINNLSFNQIAHDCIIGINKYLNNHSNEIAIYSLNKEPPIIAPACAIYNINELNIIQDAIVLATDVYSIIAAADYTKLQIVAYVYDPMLFELVPPEVLQKIKEMNISYICRTDNHAKYLKSKLGDISIIGIIDNFDFDTIWKTIHGKN